MTKTITDTIKKPISLKVDWDAMRLTIFYPRYFEGVFTPIPEESALLQTEAESEKSLIFSYNNRCWYLKMPDWVKCYSSVRTLSSELQLDSTTKILTGYSFNEISFYLVPENNDECLMSQKIKHSYKTTVSSKLQPITSSSLSELRKNTFTNFTVVRISGKDYLAIGCDSINWISKLRYKNVDCSQCLFCFARSEEEGGCSKVNDRIKAFERYPFITDAFISCSMDGDELFINHCEHFKKDKRPRASLEINI